MLQMRFAAEVRSPQELKIPSGKEVTKAELKLANQLIDQLTRPFDPDEYKDSYREELERIIEEKVQGETPKAAKTPKKAEVKDLMAALKASLEKEKKGQPARKSA